MNYKFKFKKIIGLLMSILATINLLLNQIAFAETTPMDLIGEEGKASTFSSFDTFFSTLKEYVLPFIPFLIVLGSIIYFLLGVRSKERREKGISYMIVAAFIYLILETVPLIVELVKLDAFKGIKLNAYEIVQILLDGIQLLSLPVTVFFVIVGYTIANTLGARNMQKKRVGDTMVVGSMVFCVLINVVIFLYPYIFVQK